MSHDHHLANRSHGGWKTHDPASVGWIAAALIAVAAFFGSVPGVVADHENAFSDAYVARLFPAYRVEPEIVARARALAALEGDRLPTLRRLLVEAADDLERAVTCRAVAEA